MKPPTIEEVREYAREMEYSDINVEKFLAHYDAIGWIVVVKGKALPMKSWKGALRTWAINGREYAKREHQETKADQRRRMDKITEQYLKEYTENIQACMDWFDCPEKAPMGEPRDAARTLWRKAHDHFGKSFCDQLRTRLKLKESP